MICDLFPRRKMDLSGIAPETPACKASILLLDYRPSFSVQVIVSLALKLLQTIFLCLQTKNFNEAS